MLGRLLTRAADWRRHRGAEPESYPFLGVDRWRRIAETRVEPDHHELKDSIKIAARRADESSRTRAPSENSLMLIRVDLRVDPTDLNPQYTAPFISNEIMNTNVYRLSLD